MSIEKCKPSFDEANITIKRAPFTQLYNKVLQTCSNMEALAVWAYLQSQCDDWNLNPVQLRKHFKVGKDKIYAILTYMIDTKLLVRHVQIAQNGRHITTSYTVLDGTDYLDTATGVQENAPLPDLPEAAEPDPVNKDYKKERGLQKKEFKKEISNNNCAIDIAREDCTNHFDTFWESYPVKKNKTRAKKIWDKNKYGNFVALICEDITLRLANDSQWQNKQYIPHPSTYLTNQLWNDEITENQSGNQFTGKTSAWDKYQQDLKNQHGGYTYEHSSIPQ